MKENKGILFVIFSVFLLLGVLLIRCRYEEAECEEQSSMQKLELHGTYQYEFGGVTYPINSKMNVDANKTPMLILKGHFTSDVDRNRKISLRAPNISIEIYRNNQLVYSYGVKNQGHTLYKTGGDVWCSYYTDGISTKDNITIILKNPYLVNEKRAFMKFLEMMCVGDRIEIAEVLFKDRILTCILPGTIIILGMVIMLTYIHFRKAGIEMEKSVVWCGCLIIMAGIWAFIDNPIIFFFIPHRLMVSIASQFMLLIIGLLRTYYHTYILSGKRKHISCYLTGVTGVTIMIGMLLQIMGIYDIMESYIVIFPIVLMNSVITTICMCFEYASKRTKIHFLYVASDISFSIFSCSAVFSRLVLKERNNTSFYCAFFVFAVIQFIGITSRTTDVFMKSRSAEQLKLELLQNNISIALSQIQPHFLFNTLTAIKQLCKSNPKRAEREIDNFSRYLRGNLDSLGKKEFIPFDKEMDHVQCYLRLEKLRFDERIEIQYDIEERDFLIPPLTLQPIVENAVKHGVTKKEEGGFVKIATRREQNTIVICVQDDGVGFRIGQKNTEEHTHIGIENVRNRLEKMCRGELHIQSEVGVGTTVCIRIPLRM